jgi:putative adenylate-forming enzyme
MNIGLLASLLRERARLHGHERWSRDELAAYQARKLGELRTFAVARSPFYAELHRGLDNAPLEALPTISKAQLMERFDSLVTDRDVRLADVERHLEAAVVTDLYRGRYRAAATGGTTGRRGVFLADPHEWTTVLASYARAYAWAGLNPSLTNRLRMAVVSSTNPTHQSAIVGATVASPFVPTLRLDAAAPAETIVDELNDFRPDALVGYASVLRQLAAAQRDGHLQIAPRAVFSASEVLTEETRALTKAAFGVPATNVYAATETAGIASECAAGHLHRYEDLVIAEIVDEDNRPVAPGGFGAKLLVTVLFSRTQPLIRYELSDRVAASPVVPTDLPFATLAGIEGRQEELLQLGGLRVHPNVFHGALERLPVAGWQVIDEGGRLRVLLAEAGAVEPGAVERKIRSALANIGVAGVAIRVELVDAIPRTALGKAPLIRRVGRTPVVAAAAR